MEEYASRFYLFLDYGFTIRAENRLHALITASYPQMTQPAKKKIMDSLSRVVNPQKPSTIQNDREKLKQLLKIKSKT